MMLSVYTFVFSEVFQARWGGLSNTGPLTFAINLFAGLIIFNLLAETAMQSTSLLLNNKNLITKVRFPVEILPVVTVTAAAFHAGTSLIILIIFQLTDGFLTGSDIHLGADLLYVPLLLIPLLSGCLTVAWLLAGLGVFLRDLGQVVGVGTNLLMFLSTIFYPLSALPERWRPYLQLNPLVGMVEQSRELLIGGIRPDPHYIIVSTMTTIITAESAFRLFQKMKKGFSDVL